MAEEIANRQPMALRDYALPTATGIYSAIRRPAIQANNFELKPVTLQMIQGMQFNGLPNEDPNAHIANFLEICDTVKYHGVSDDALRLRLFPFSLRDRAKNWLNSLPPDSITTWDELVQKFLAKFFPPAKTARMRIEITNFAQYEGETLYEAWDRFKELLRKCPHHGLQTWWQVQTFYNGLNSTTRTLVDASAGGALMNKSDEQAYDLLETMASNNFQWPSERITAKKSTGTYDNDAIAALTAQVASLANQLKQSKMGVNAVNIPQMCDFCQGNHATEECQGGNQFVQQNLEQAQFVGNFNNPYSNTYNPGWKSHPNLQWRNNQPTGQPQFQAEFQQVTARMDKLEEALVNFTTTTNQAISNLTNKVDNFISQAKIDFQNQSAQVRSLEVQMGQMTNSMSSHPQGSLPSNTEVNPREHCMAVTLRTGKELLTPTKENIVVDEERNHPKQVEGSPAVNPTPVQEEEINVPYPNRLKKNKTDKQFSKFLEVFKKLHINIPFADALEQMPMYVKFMKEILARKRRIEDYGTVALTEECSAVIQRKLPQKLKDPGRFTIPCQIGNSIFEKALCDLGASINLMPLSIFRKLGLGEARPTTVTLQMADRSIKHPRGVIEDVLVKVDKFIFPADFVVLDMEEDNDVPIILGRPFLATGRALIDVQKGELTLRVNNEKAIFKVFKPIKVPKMDDSCSKMDTLDVHVPKNCYQPKDLLEATLTDPNRVWDPNPTLDKNPEVLKIFEWNNGVKASSRKPKEKEVAWLERAHHEDSLPADQVRYAFTGNAYEKARMSKEPYKEYQST